MALLVGQPAWLEQVYTLVADGHSPRLGKVVRIANGDEYIFLQGIGSTVQGSLVSYGLTATNKFLTALSVTGVRGPVAFAVATTPPVASQYGWYQITGRVQANYNGAAVAGAKLYSASTGKVDDAVVSGDQVDHAFVSATVSGSGLGDVYCDHPWMDGLG